MISAADALASEDFGSRLMGETFSIDKEVVPHDKRIVY